VAADLAVEEPVDIEKIRAFVPAQPERVQTELREALAASGLAQQEIEKRMGPAFH
jgi:hypothetical protein